MLLSSIHPEMIDWARAQFALTACYHWLFVPLTLGLAVIMGVMETLYYKHRSPFWKQAAQFWQKLFGINFAIGVATGIILEFEFGTNWSNYSWFVGDIFGAPLAIEGILAFFMEATFIAVMFFGWEKVSKGFHLASTWLTGIGATLSAWWILVANSWMQYPRGMAFNPDTVRNEMQSFIDVAFAPEVVTKFFHTILSGWMTGAVFVVGVSAWFLLRKRNIRLALESAKIGAIVGIAATVGVLFTGDLSGIQIAKHQPMKLAAAEGLYDGGKGAALSIIPGIEIPKALSFLATHDIEGYVPGVNDILYKGYTSAEGTEVLPATQKMEIGSRAVATFREYRSLRRTNPDSAVSLRPKLASEMPYFGYGLLQSVDQLTPPIPLIYWAFRIMVGSGMLLFGILILVLFYGYKKKLQHSPWVQHLALWSVPFVYLAGQCGWIVAEVGRQPWAIQDLLPVNAAISNLPVGAVMTTFFIFLILFTILLIAEIRIMCKAIKNQKSSDE